MEALRDTGLGVDATLLFEPTDVEGLSEVQFLQDTLRLTFDLRPVVDGEATLSVHTANVNLVPDIQGDASWAPEKDDSRKYL